MSAKHGKKKKKSPAGAIVAAVLVLALLGVGGFFGWKAYQKKNASPPQAVLAEYLDSLGAMRAEELSSAAGIKAPSPRDGGRPRAAAPRRRNAFRRRSAERPSLRRSGGAEL